ncbi:hypothetical protein Cni_G12984 [Canna indica]|uniref:Protein TIC 20 n=1 Tax=Canna indica TaxID=4628 RepID=A0AAQ3K8T2_9LILI|nr:hypothetical protein Cni_G12984 [Canna indica]
MQVVILDVLLALLALFQRVFDTPSRGVGFRVMEMGYHAIFAFSFACFVYSIFSCVLGRMLNLPILAVATDRQLYTGITLSEEQLKYAKRRAKEAGLEAKSEFLNGIE